MIGKQQPPRSSRPCAAVVGLAGSGLTEACVQHYRTLLNSTDQPDRIVFLVRSQAKAAEVMRRLQALQPTLVGPLRIETFLGLVNRVLAEFWAEIRACVPQLPASFAPLVLPKDLTQHLLVKTCAVCPRHAPIFQASGLRDYLIWDQLTSTAYIAGSSGLEVGEIGQRLVQAWPDAQAEAKIKQLAAVGCCVTRLRSEALRWGALDFGTQIDLFDKVVLTLPEFWDGIDHLIVDQVEDSCAVALKFYQQGLAKLQSLFFAYTIGGGVSFTAVPDQIAHFVIDQSDYRPLRGSYKGSDAMIALGHHLAQRIDPEFDHPLPITPVADLPEIRFLEGDTQQDAAELMIQAIRDLFEAGVTAGDIAVITPRVDAGLALTLQNRLGDRVLPISPFPSLVQYPLVRALLTLIELAHPTWGLFPTLAELAVMLGILLDLDPVRAELLAEDVLDPVARALRQATAVRFPERIGFANLRRYQLLWEWVHQVQQTPDLPLDHLLGKLFADLLCTRMTKPEEHSLIQTVIDTAQRFRQTLPHCAPQELLTMIRSGQTPSRSLADPDYTQFLVIAAPIAYINLGLSAAYQFWFDSASDLWSRSLWRPLYNPKVLTPEWDLQPFGEEQENRCKAQILAKTLLNLCCRTRKGLWLVRCSFNFRGEENTGILDQLILESLRA
jgi:hypothetical protein